MKKSLNDSFERWKVQLVSCNQKETVDELGSLMINTLIFPRNWHDQIFDFIPDCLLSVGYLRSNGFDLIAHLISCA